MVRRCVCRAECRCPTSCLPSSRRCSMLFARLTKTTTATSRGTNFDKGLRTWASASLTHSLIALSKPLVRDASKIWPSMAVCGAQVVSHVVTNVSMLHQILTTTAEWTTKSSHTISVRLCVRLVARQRPPLFPSHPNPECCCFGACVCVS